MLTTESGNPIHWGACGPGSCRDKGRGGVDEGALCLSSWGCDLFAPRSPHWSALPSGQAPGPHPAPHPPLVPTGPHAVVNIHQDRGRHITGEVLAAQGPVGTRGGVEWMRGPCACPRGGATCLLHAVPSGARCHQDKHQAPTLPHIRPLALQDPIRSSTFIRHRCFGNESYPLKTPPFHAAGTKALSIQPLQTWLVHWPALPGIYLPYAQKECKRDQSCHKNV